MARAQSTEVYISAEVRNHELRYTFGLDWRREKAPAPLWEACTQALFCTVTRPDKYAGYDLTAYIGIIDRWAAATVLGARTGPRAVGSLLWTSDRWARLYVPSADAFWGIGDAVRSGNLRYLDLTVEGPIRGTRDVIQFAFAGTRDDDLPLSPLVDLPAET
jgi:hypothetical protein